MLNILYIVAAWLVREVVLKSLLVGAIYWAVVILMPMVLSYVTPYLSTTGLTSVASAGPERASRIRASAFIWVLSGWRDKDVGPVI